MANLQEEKLVRKAIRGNTKAYGQLIHSYQEYLYRTAYLYVKDEDAALDVVQDCILKGYEAIGNLREPKYFNDMKINEIAEAMNIPEGSVKAYLSRARQELKKYLKEEYIYA